jgi:hypothetical protein
MSTCEFKVSFKESAEEIMNKAKSAVESQGGTFNGDLVAGDFNVSLLSNKVSGKYSVEGNEMTLTIFEKPMFIPCNAIESFLIKKLS